MQTVPAFLRAHRDRILRTWEDLVRGEVRRVELSGLALRDSIPAFLDDLSEWLATGAPPGGQRLGARSLQHVLDRLDQGLDLGQMLREYRLLREAILREILAAEEAQQGQAGSSGDGDREARVIELARLNAGLDVAISGAMEQFIAERDRRAADERERASTTLRETEERLRSFLTASADVVYRMSPDWGEMRYLAGKEFLPDTDRPSRTWLDRYVLQEDQPRVLAAIQEAVRERRPFDLEHLVRRVDGTAGWIHSRAVPRYDERGELVEWVGTASDITARKEAEQTLLTSEERYRRLVEQVSDGIFVADPETRYTDVNPAACEMLGRSREELLESTFLDVLAPEEHARLPRTIAAFADGKVHRDEWRFRRKDGSIFVGELDGRRFPDGRFLGIVRDVTERRQAEEALRRSEERLREGDRRKTDFLAVLSHELRNPLAPIRNSIHLLERAEPGSEPFVRARKIIERQTDHLARLVDDLLDVVRITRGRIELHRERVDLRELVHQAADGARPLFAQAGVELRVEPALDPLWLDADPTRIAQLVGNLLHNAQKFTPPGGGVTVSLSSASGQVHLRVRDTGVGMVPGREQEMFEAFAQGEQGLARTKGGLGLGLSLVKLFAEMHGGRVAARSEGPGRGTEFVVTLPLAASQAPRAGAGERPAAAARRVLVIEDNADAAQSLADVLALDGHVVEVASRGNEGVALAREHHPDVILCDIGLPDMDGYEVARQVRASAGLEQVRLVALTGYAQPEDREHARQAGFDAHLAKPPSPEGLARALTPGG